MILSFHMAAAADVFSILIVRNAAGNDLTERYGKGHWSLQATENGILNNMTDKSTVLVAKENDVIVGTLRLSSQKPWAIDPSYFTAVPTPLYLTDMAVHPQWQHKGIGRFMLASVQAVAAAWPAQAIRLDAYDNKAGAGDFYRKCGYVERGRIVYRKVPLIYFEQLLLQE